MRRRVFDRQVAAVATLKPRPDAPAMLDSTKLIIPCPLSSRAGKGGIPRDLVVAKEEG
jgi:hypothetical protein